MDLQRRRRTDGTTAVEVLAAAFILAVLAVGTGAYMGHARTSVWRQQSRRQALEAANARMEELRAAKYDAVAPPWGDTNAYYVSRQGTGWVHAATDPGETIVSGSRVLPMTTTVRYRDIDGGSETYDYLHLTVRAYCASNRDETVGLETYRAL